MKKYISILIVVVLLFNIAIPVCAGPVMEKSRYPIVYFRGNSETIVDENDKVVYNLTVGTETIKEIAKKVLPLFAEGMITNNFDEYYKVFGEELSKIYEKAQLDKDGNPQYGTGISEDEKRNNIREMNSDFAQNGKYYITSYAFANDWRLDPFATVDEIDRYIDGILSATGKEKVNLACKCLGGDLILAYLQKYGTSKINAVCFGSTVAFGDDLADCVYRGKINFDGAGVSRFVSDDYAAGLFSEDQQLLYDFVKETVRLAEVTGIFDGVSQGFMKLVFSRIYKGLFPELVLASYGTWPGYWTMITSGHYAEAKSFIFGAEGSEKREYYAGLIEKLDYYDDNVRQRIPEILKSAEADGVKICITSKYGFQMPPLTVDSNEQGDIWASTRYSSHGATVAETGTVLSDGYIASRTEAGYGKYISPDGQVDASTCLFPDYTWFIKGAVHNDWTYEEDNILVRVCDAQTQLTVDTMTGYPQFLVYDRQTDSVAPMTKDNCNTESYEVKDNSSEKNSKLGEIIVSYFSWIKSLFRLIKQLLNEK